MTAELPIHFFTIVLNGKPFVEHHIEVFRRLPMPWYWHIVEGVADLKHDTAWSVQLGGRITERLHRNGLSHDGTSEYLDSVALEFPHKVAIYRKPPGVFWDGKIEMVNAPLKNIQSECLLWQVDSDELWTVDQIRTTHELFIAFPEKTAAYFFCHYFVGKNLIITSRGTYGNHPEYEWLRTWRFRPGMRWIAHEPPQLGEADDRGQWKDVAATNPFRHAETEPRGLVFQHFAYVTEKQLEFKEFYYGYKNAVAQWHTLQKETALPVRLRKYFSWVRDHAVVDRAETQDFGVLARENIIGQWRFRPNLDCSVEPERILWVRVDSIGDNVLAASMLPHLRAKFPFAEITVVCLKHIAELYEACPFVDCVVPLDNKRFKEEKRYRRAIAAHLQSKRFDLLLNSTYSRDDVSDMLASLSGAREKIGFEADLSNFSAEVRERYRSVYDRVLPTDAHPKPELARHQDFLNGLGIRTQNLMPSIWWTPADEAWAEEFFTAHRLNSDRTLALFPAGQQVIKDYHQFAAVLRQMPDYDVVIFGKRAAPVIQSLINGLPNRCINMVGRTTLRQMSACFRLCTLYVGVDSAGAHIACAVGLPNVVVLGGGNFGRFLPYSRLTSIVSLPLDCFGCNWDCRFSEAYCMSRIAPELVLAAVQQTLAERADSPRVFFPQISLAESAHLKAPAFRPMDSLLDESRVRLIPVSVGDPFATSAPQPNPSRKGLTSRLRRWFTST